MSVTRFVNGSIFTADRRRSDVWAESVVVENDRIVAVGRVSDLATAYPAATVFDLAGRTLLPGLIDAHNHFLSTGESLASIDARSLDRTNREFLYEKLRAAATTAPAGSTITAYGLDPDKFVDGAIDRWELDRVLPEHRVLIYHVSGHGAVANSAVLTAAGIDRDTVDPAGGWFVRNDAGTPTGWCFDAALSVLAPVAVEIGAHGPNFHALISDDELHAAILRAQSAFFAAGLTSVCDAQVTSREMAAYQRAHASGELKIRTTCMPLSHQLDEYLAIGLSSGFGDELLAIGPMKFYADGSLSGGTAFFCDPYEQSADAHGGGHGHLLRPMAEISQDLVRASEAGWRVGVHAIGDAAITELLPAFEAAAAVHLTGDLRPRIEHAELPPDELLARLCAVEMIAVTQPSYLYEMGEQYLERIGDRATRLMPLRSMLDAGIRVVISSDSDVASYRPLDTIAAAMTRTTVVGRPMGVDQILTLDEALYAHTVDAAYAIGRETDLGVVQEGFLADFTIVDGDLRSVEPAAIRELSIAGTMVGGTWVYQR